MVVNPFLYIGFSQILKCEKVCRMSHQHEMPNLSSAIERELCSMFVQKVQKVTVSESTRKGRVSPRLTEPGPPGTES